MKIVINQESFLTSLGIVTKAIKRNSIQQAIFQCVLIDATKEKIVLTCTDGKEMTIKRETEGQILEKGKAAIEGIDLLGIVRSMPEKKELELSVNNKLECVIKCENKINQSFQAKDESVFPNVMSINKENKVIINEYKFKKIIEKTSFSYDKNQTTDNIILKGIYLFVNKDKIVSKSMDGYILSIINENLNIESGKNETIIPGSSLEEIGKLIKGDIDKDVYIYFNEKNIGFEFNKTLISSTIIPNKYIETDKILNCEYSTKVNINRSDFINCLQRCNNFSNETDKKPVVFEIKDNILEARLNSIKGDSYEIIDIKKSGKDLNIAFNPNSLIKILNAIDEEEITLYFSGSKQPVIIKDKNETYTYLLTAVVI